MILANAHFVDSDITGTASGTGSWSAGTQDRTTAHPQNYSHLEGETVNIVKAGVVLDDQDVTGGAVTGTPDHVGLNYVTTIKPMKLDLEGMGIILTKKVTKAIINFHNSLGAKVGPDLTRMETVSFGTDLFSGTKETHINDGYDRDADVIIQQDDPMPMVVRGVVFEVGAYNK